ncbi:MAG: Gldg family protein [Planctomycetes bacterium]|nr:Gldg family protein [Planctomycetota bacterium]
MNSKKLFTATGLALALALFVAFNTLSRSVFRSARLDLTQEKLYTLSPGSRNILANLGEPVRLRFFFSKKLAKDMTPLLAFAQRVQELMEEYAAHSAGKLKLEVLDPEPYSEEEEAAVEAGLQGVPLNASGETLYFGVVGTNSTDENESIPFIRQERESLLEYDLTRMVYNLAHPKKKVVGLISKLPMEGDPMARFRNPNADAGGWFMLDQIRERFEVRSIPETMDKIEDGIDVLMVVHPQGLPPQMLYAIDQYVLGGGKALVFVDPNCIAQEVRNDPNNPLTAMMADRSSDLGPLLAAWGVDYKKDDIAADKENALRVSMPNGGSADYIVWLEMTSEGGALDKQDAITSQLKSVRMATCGILSKLSGATTTVTPLIETSKNSMIEQKNAIQFGDDPKKLLESFVSGGAQLMLAARVNGPAKTAYPEGKPKAQPADGEQPDAAKDAADAAGLKESKGPINVVVVADADLLADRWWTRTQNFFGQKIASPTADNNGFVLNALENLSGNNDLISLRGRGNSVRPFDKVNEIRREADTRFLAKENELEEKLKDLKTQLGQLQKSGDGTDALILSDEQRKKIEEFRDEQVATSRELRRVKHERNQEIESLGTRIKLLNTFALPLLVILAAVGLASLRPKPKGG